jgi:hypothetical protein
MSFCKPLLDVSVECCSLSCKTLLWWHNPPLNNLTFGWGWVGKFKIPSGVGADHEPCMHAARWFAPLLWLSSGTCCHAHAQLHARLDYAMAHTYKSCNMQIQNVHAWSNANEHYSKKWTKLVIIIPNKRLHRQPCPISLFAPDNTSHSSKSNSQ